MGVWKFYIHALKEYIIHLISRLIVWKVQKSFEGLKKDIEKLNEEYDIVYMFITMI